MQLRPLLLLIAVLSACSSSQEKPSGQQVAIPVLAAAPAVKDVPIYVEAVGALNASVRAEVRPQVGGTIAEVLVKEGGWVAPGAPLFTIDSSSYEVKLHEAAAKLEMDKAVLEATRRSLERFRSLADKDLISKAEWDELETAEAKAAALFEADTAALRSAELNLAYCSLTACVDGRVGKVDVHPGQLVAAGQATPLVTIDKMDPLVVEFALTEKEAAALPSGEKPLELLSLHTGEIVGNGIVTFLDNSYDGRTGLITVRGKVFNSGLTLRPGQSVRVRIPVSTIKDAMLIPQKAVKYNQEGPYIYVVGEESTVALRKVILGDAQDKEIIVLEGVQPQERVITDGHMRIYPGSTVEVQQ